MDECGLHCSQGTVEFAKVDLSDMPSVGSIGFLYADVAANRNVPFAAVHYAEDGQEQELGVRLDADKRVFFDHFEGEKEHAFVQALPEILDRIGRHFRSQIQQVSGV